LPKTHELPPSLRTSDQAVERETILLVEDDEALRVTLTEALVEAGYRLLPAAGFAHALEITQVELDAIDLVVTNVLLEGMNGLDLARVIRRARPELKVLFVSNSNQGVLAQHGIVGGKVEHLEHPVDPRHLAMTVRNALDRGAN
jgi:two-component system cell cycle sensor histidine kinase/response regulator CckA